ncbi:polysaccharide biosynthesis tyrosine autokinase [Anaeromyxobacter oryzae]|uniref:Tyrosine kinase BceF n=1 Tax=Anaeromyxobacter oryzae TaxID=2918170 RepID=A0ABN6MRH6_9BACT|nr:polysaccharide biosynthesis tyrosine autokinase [Anaeromyxobacter oryzae]BDG02298.1 tyrosine kinase BceF [Anaeromyxobacter oryzae]
MTRDESGTVVGLPGAEPDAPRARAFGRAPSGSGEAEPTLAELVRIVRGGRWLVMGLAAVFVALGSAYLFLKAPIYEANVVVQVEDHATTVTRLDELSAALGEKPPSDAEMELMRSRTLLESVVDELGLDVEARPRTFPVVGAAVARLHEGPDLAAAPLGLDAYAWGGERIVVKRLQVSDDLLDEPLRVDVGVDGRLEVQGPRGPLARGRVGAPVEGHSDRTRVEMYVSDAVARPGTSFVVTKRRRSDVVDRLQRAVVVTERGKKTGILVAELEDRDPERVAAIVDALAQAYLRQNVERRSAEAAKTLAFLESQLPSLKGSLASAESAVNSYQQRKGTVDLSREAQAMLDRTVEVERQLSELQLQRSELSDRFTDQHPTMMALKEKEDRLRSQRAAINARMKDLPEKELDSTRLARDVKVANDMYMTVLNKVQELRVVKSGTVGTVRIVDHAVVPHEPTSPRPLPVLAVSLLLGLCAGVAAAFARDALEDVASDPDEIERATGVPVYATVPHSPRQVGLVRRRHRRGARAPLLAAADPGDLAIENIRSLRTSLHFALVDAPTNVVAISGPGPGLGKSFVAVNLAHVLAAAERRVLLVDGDLRRGRLHRAFGLSREPGVSELVGQAISAELAIRGTDYPRLDLLSTGHIPPNPADLLASDRFQRILADASRRYDVVLLDTPPILAVTDGLIEARLASVILLVLRAGHHPLREIALTVKRLAQNGIKVHGAVLNDVMARGKDAAYAGYYHYEYRSLKAD